MIRIARAACAVMLGAAAATLPGAAAHSQPAQNSGNCVIIVQGSGNSATLNGCVPRPTFPPEPQAYHIWQTPNLGIRIEQDGKWVPIFPKSWDATSVQIVNLAAKPFIIWVPEDHWAGSDSDLPALQISASWDPQILRLPSSQLFSPGSGMAADMRGDGWLFLVSPKEQVIGHNYIIGHRFDRRMPEWRGLFVSLMDIAPRTGRNLIEPDSDGYLVLLMQEDDTPKLPCCANKRDVPIEDAPRDNVVLEFHAPR